MSEDAPRAALLRVLLYYICVLVLLYMCPRTAIYVFSYYYICVLILLYMGPHTAIYVFSYYCICVLVPLYMCVIVGRLSEDAPRAALLLMLLCSRMLLCLCPHTTVYVSSYCYICVLIGRLSEDAPRAAPPQYVQAPPKIVTPPPATPRAAQPALVVRASALPERDTEGKSCADVC